MKQIRKIVFLIIMFFAFLINVGAKTVCEYGDKLTLTFEGESLDINQDFYPNKIENEYGWFYDTFVENQSTRVTDILTDDNLVLVEGACPSEITYCKYEEFQLGLHPVSNVADTIKVAMDGGSFGEIVIQFVNLVESKKFVYVGETKNALFDKYDDLKKAEEGVKEGGLSFWVDFKDAFTNPDLTVSEKIGTFLEGYAEYAVLLDYKSTYKECGEIEYKGELPTYNLACPKVANFVKDYSVAGTNYKNATGNDKLDKLAIVKEKETQIREYCKTLLQNYDYEGLEGDCIDSCLNIEDTIHSFKKTNGLLHDASTECGFSKRLLSFVANVIKWVKFILPVIVIVLGILDFIKAIGAEKDDDIKKAQKKFIYRLIAAALIFIVPFILEFVLDKLGFSDYTSGCGVITEIE